MRTNDPNEVIEALRCTKNMENCKNKKCPYWTERKQGEMFMMHPTFNFTTKETKNGVVFNFCDLNEILNDAADMIGAQEEAIKVLKEYVEQSDELIEKLTELDEKEYQSLGFNFEDGTDMTDEEMEGFNKIILATIENCIAFADKTGIDRDSMLKASVDILSVMSNTCTFDGYKVQK